jgi:hypothetical protein
MTALRNNGAGVFQAVSTGAASFRSHDVVLGDLNGDGFIDALEINRGQPSRVLLGRTGLVFESASSAGLGPTSVAASLGDLDGDGDLDVFVANAYGEANRVWLNDGSALLVDSGQRLGEGDSDGVALTDIDGDGDLDAIVANRETDNHLWLNDGLGRFHDSGQHLGGNAGGVAVGDVDGDGDVDAVLVAAQGAVNTIWQNQNGQFTQLPVNIGNSFGQAVAMGDLNNDGTLDIVFASNFEPMGRIWLNFDSAALGDFDGSGIVDEHDYALWRAEYGRMGVNLASDANGDGHVDTVDYVVWRKNQGRVLATAVANSQSVPTVEPSTGTLEPSRQPAPSIAEIMGQSPTSLIDLRVRPTKRTTLVPSAEVVFSRSSLDQLLISSSRPLALNDDWSVGRRTLGDRGQDSAEHHRSFDQAIETMTCGLKDASMQGQHSSLHRRNSRRA